MTLKIALLIAGVAAIPAWYTYRTLSDHRVPRLTWNDVFTTEDEQLRKQMLATEERAQKAVAEAEEKASVISRRKEAAAEIRNCLDTSKTIRAEFAAFFEEESRWTAEISPLLSTKAGIAIAGNEDYVRAFREFTENVTPRVQIKATDPEIEQIAQTCEQYQRDNPIDVSTYVEVRRLQEIQKQLREDIRNLKVARSNVATLIEIASGQAPHTLEVGIQRQRVRELIENYKWRREREQILGRQ